MHLTSFRLTTIAIFTIFLLLGCTTYSTLNEPNKTSVNSSLSRNSSEIMVNRTSSSLSSLDVETLITDDFKIGLDSAPLVMIEFADYQCPFCRRFALEVMPNIKREYIEMGKVQYIKRDFPVLTSVSQNAAEAVECSGEQGRALDMHQKIYEMQATQGVGRVIFTANDLREWAKQLNLNSTRFNECLNSGKYLKKIQKDIELGRSYGVDQTPYFFVATRDRKNIVPIVGAQPYGTVKAIFDQMLGAEQE